MQQVGTPDEIYATPANRFVAEFIGTPRLNMIPLHQPSSGLAQHLQQRFTLHEQTRHCGIRPEEIVLSREPDNNGIPMTIDNIMPTGGSWVIELIAGQDRLFHSTQLRRAGRSASRFTASSRPPLCTSLIATGCVTISP